MHQIAIIDYGMGNLESVKNALHFLNYKPIVTSDKDAIASANAYILPGVGAFAMAMRNLKERGLIDVLGENVMTRKKPFLGICLGMQLIAESSSEMGLHPGLGWIKATVVQIEGGPDLKVPHVGWNDVRISKDGVLFKRLSPAPHFYFDHYYQFMCDASQIAATCDYGVPIIAAVEHDNICATQFHPEKSQTTGLRLLRNFLNFAESVRC
ncbi:MAG TPA: imidazole glycerol phosphate synthase subunit HisH [Gemmatimonadaceae bacterium]